MRHGHGVAAAVAFDAEGGTARFERGLHADLADAAAEIEECGRWGEGGLEAEGANEVGSEFSVGIFGALVAGAF